MIYNRSHIASPLQTGDSYESAPPSEEHPPLPTTPMPTPTEHQDFHHDHHEDPNDITNVVKVEKLVKKSGRTISGAYI